MIKVAYDLGDLNSEDKIRGIGVNTNELFNSLLSQKNDNLTLDGVDVTKVDLSKYNIVHFTVFRPFFKNRIPLFKPARTKFILTIHDLIQLIYPSHFKAGIKGKIIFFYNKFLIWKNIDVVVTISETSKKDICRFLNISPQKVFVSHLAPKKVFKPIKDSKILNSVSERYKLPKKFVLYTGDINYNKNIPLLVKVCNELKLQLVIVGKQAANIQNLNFSHPELIHLKNVDFSKVIRLGFVGDEELATIMNLAEVYVQPSLYEGFGLPILEALACGTPVIAAHNQAHVEIAENDCTFFNANSLEELKEKLKAFDKKKVKMSNAFSWDKTAKRIINIYEKI